MDGRQGSLIVAMVSLLLSSGWHSALAGDLKGHLQFGYEKGGDGIVEVNFINTGDREVVTAGNGLYFAGGLAWVPRRVPLEARLSLGYKADSAVGSNLNTHFTRWPAEFMAAARLGAHRLGGGVTYHLDPTFKCHHDDGSCDGEFDFATAPGFFGQYDFVWLPDDKDWPLVVSLRYTRVEYGLGGFTWTGDSVGVLLGSQF